jgi:hypothetical protein
MPDDDVVVGEVGADPIDAPNPIADFLKSVEDQNFVGAEAQFNDMVSDRLSDAMDQAKIKIASNLYGDGEPEADVEPEEEEVDVEDLDDSEPEEDMETEEEEEV